MKFKVSSTALYSRLTIASKVLASKNSMPILECFLLNVKNGEIAITASDSEKYLLTSVPTIEQDEDACFCVQAKTILESIKELAEQPITFEFKPETYVLKGVHSSGSFTVVAQDAAPYPMPKTVSDDATTLNISGETLLNGISRCLFATSNDEIRLVMNGIYFDIKPDRLIFAGTDGRKLVRNTVYSVQSGLTSSFIVSKKVAAILKNTLTKNDEMVEIRFDTDKACIKTADITMHFRLTEGRYPNYNAVIPNANPYVVTVDRQALASALKRISVFCNQSSGLVKVELNNNQLKLTGQDNEYATSAVEYLNCEYANNPTSIGFSCQYLLEIANIMEGEEIRMELGDPSRPGVIRPAEESENEELLMLLMPMRVEE